MDLGISGRTALITGGGRGLGAAVARLLAAEGVRVVVAARDVARLEAVAAGIVADGGSAVAVPFDVGDSHAVRAGFATATAALGPPTIVVHCAASHYTPTRLHNVDDVSLAAMLATDVAGPVHVARAALPAMMEAAFGRLVFVGSLAATHGATGGAVYGMAKAGMEGLAAGIALDYGRYGITATTVRAGLFTSERFDARQGDDDARRERLRQSLPTRQLPTPQEMAAAVLFLCSASAWTVTGATLTSAAGGQLAAVESSIVAAAASAATREPRRT
jgi:NAD(P)-dependent dehydrogenase (short-subunit alcohol dehydrogenase family)